MQHLSTALQSWGYLVAIDVPGIVAETRSGLTSKSDRHANNNQTNRCLRELGIGGATPEEYR